MVPDQGCPAGPGGSSAAGDGPVSPRILPAMPTAGIAAPFDAHRDVVRSEWIDHNQHMNMGYYLVVFDLATDAFFSWVGLGEAHREAHAVTTFCLEAHVTYHRELRAGDPLRFTTLLL